MNAVKTQTRTDAQPVRVACSHCGLRVPRGLVEPGQPDQFCCAGCQTAFHLIHASGLDAFYKMAEKDPARRLPDANPANLFMEFDRPEFQIRFGREINPVTREITFQLDGIHCAACIWLIEKLPQIKPGVLSVHVNWAKQTARIRWDNRLAGLSDIAKTLHQLGYSPQPFRESQHERRRDRENRRHLIRIGIAAAAAGNNMLIATALYLGMFSYMSAGMNTVLRIASCLVGLVSLLGPGRIFLVGAWNAIRTRTAHMDLPIALGLLVGSVAGLVNTILGVGEIYFDSLSVLIFLLLTGRWIQFRQQNRAADSIEMLGRLTPRQTRKIVNGEIVETFVDLVQPGDRLQLRVGDVMPVDGVIEQGSSRFDESILSGESKPVVKTTGDLVLAGTTNCESMVIVRATATGRETRLSGIVDLVEQASIDKPQIVQWANRTGGYFVGVVVALALITFFVWLRVDVDVAVQRTVALLIVACPCALAIATPLAIAVSMGRAAKQKIMIKNGDVLQSLRHPGLIWLDKTGTITEGDLEVVEWHGQQDFLSDITGLQTHSSHPVAKAIAEYAAHHLGNRRIPDSSVATSVRQYPGMGIEGVVEEQTITIGTEQFIRSQGIAVPRSWVEQSNQILASGLSPCWIARHKKIVAMAAVGDRIRPDTASAISELVKRGWQIGVLSGDHPVIVDQVARRLGIEATRTSGGVSPEEKLRIIQDSMTTFDTVVMVGDGVNDSAALAASTVGIAVHNGAEASLAAAPVYLANEGLTPILELLSISNRCGHVMMLNLAISLTYNISGVLLAFAGLINPLVAAILMPASSLTVVAISLASGTGKPYNSDSADSTDSVKAIRP